MSFYRTHLCSELTIKNLNQEVILSGWIDTIRDHGNLIFIDLRDNYGITQCVVDAQKEIAKLGVEEARVAGMKPRAAAEMQQIKQPTPSLDQALSPQATPDPKAEEWAERNPWFGQDSAMTYTAFDLHEKLTKEEGFDPNSDEYYTEVDRRMKLDFPHKFAKTEPKETTNPTQTVASATRSVKPGRNTVRLTSSQVAIAKKLGVPLEEYAKQLKITKEA